MRAARPRRRGRHRQRGLLRARGRARPRPQREPPRRGGWTCATTASSTSSPTTPRGCSAPARRAPFHVLPVGRVGHDAEGERCARDGGRRHGLRFVQQAPGRPTLLSVCFQYPDGIRRQHHDQRLGASGLWPRTWIRRRARRRAHDRAGRAGGAAWRRRRCCELGRSGGVRVAAASSAELRRRGGRALLASRPVSLNQDEAAALGGRPFAPGAAASFFEALPAVRARLVVTAGAAGAFGCDGAGARSRPGAAGPRREHRRRRRRGARRAPDRVAAGLPLFPDSSRSLAERPVDSALDLGVCLAAYAVGLAAHDPAGRGMGATALVPGPARRRFGAGARGPRGSRCMSAVGDARRLLRPFQGELVRCCGRSCARTASRCRRTATRPRPSACSRPG